MHPAETLSSQDLRACTGRLARVHLAHLPTPLELLPRFSEALGGPRVYIKRDDCTGLAFGGNKTRHNEFLLGEALAQGVDLVVWGAGVQSNNCRQTAAACARLGLDCHLVLSRAAHEDDVQGNLLVDYLVGASFEMVDAPLGPELDVPISEAAARFRAQGRNVYSCLGASIKPKAAVGYVLCMAELADQWAAAGIEPSAAYVSSAGATGAGLALGKAALGCDVAIRSIQPIRWPWDEHEDMANVANETAALLGLPVRLDANEIEVTDAYVGRAYGVPTQEGMEALSLLACTEGILLDPSYTAKAMAALIDQVRHGRYQPDESVVFIHTGGTPALFAFRDDLVRMIPRRESPSKSAEKVATQESRPDRVVRNRG